MDKRRLLPMLALGCGAYIAFAVSMFPASTALRWFAPESIRTNNVEGTIWSGSARYASVADLALRDLRWNIDILPLLLGRLSGTAEAGLPNGFANGRFSASGDDLELRNVQLSTSLSLLAELLPISGTNGALSAQLDSLSLENQWPVSAVGSVRVSDLIVEPLPGLGNQLISLGTFEILFTQPLEAESDAITASVRDRGGPLEVDANLVLNRSREYRVEGSVIARASAPDSLVQGLNFMTGEPGPDGRRELSLTGSLASPR